jgi:hypothetical protein
MPILKNYNLIGCCGIYCGICPRFHSKSKSRCSGCGPDSHCSFCSIFRCCVIKKRYETCSDCSDFPCNKFNKWFETDSFVTHIKCLPNIQKIKKVGIKDFLKDEEARMRFLEIILDKYNSGRCMSLYCQFSAHMSFESLKNALRQIESIKGDKAKSFKKLIQELAEKDNISLRLRK